MLERLKSLLLLVLIGICIRFTGLYFSRVHAPAPLLVAPAPSLVELPEEEVPSSYIDLFAPQYMLVHNYDDHYCIDAEQEQYQKLWEALKAAVDEAKNSVEASKAELIPIKAADWQRAALLSYEYRYAGPLQFHYWWLAASKATLQRFPEEVYFNRILIPLGESSIYLMNTRTEEMWRWRWADEANANLFPSISRLNLGSSQRARVARLPEGVQLVPGSQIYTPQGTLTKPEILASLPISEANKASIVKRFFSITPRMHKTDSLGNGVIVENYITARQQVLSLHNTGLIHYTENPPKPPAGAPGGTTVEQFQQVFNFVLSRGGWPKGAVSAGMEPIPSGTDKPGYRFQFVQLYGGVPVIDFVPTLSIEVVPGGVKSYHRLLYNIIKPGYFQFQVRGVEDALAQAAPAIGSRKVSDVYLAYYQRPYILSEDAPFRSDPMYLYPVWAIELSDGDQLLVHAYKLLNDPGLIKP
ncbi:MAG: hypothetical protein GX060_00045 [Firmicutes bacterium]|nr:hypothetical protein [Bacillota bacterium]